MIRTTKTVERILENESFIPQGATHFEYLPITKKCAFLLVINGDLWFQWTISDKWVNITNMTFSDYHSMNKYIFTINGTPITRYTDEWLQFMEKKENDVNFVPDRGERYYIPSRVKSIATTGKWDDCSFEKQSLNSGLIYPSEYMAVKASERLIRCQQIIRACLLVDPDFTPDFEDEMVKFSVYYDYCHEGWLEVVLSETDEDHYPAYVSTHSKAKQVCELLEKWGIK